MPVYKVKVELSAVVTAPDMKSAQLDGITALGEELENLIWHDVEVDTVQSLKDLPPGWTSSTLVYHDGDEDLTVAEALIQTPETHLPLRKDTGEAR